MRLGFPLVPIDNMVKLTRERQRLPQEYDFSSGFLTTTRDFNLMRMFSIVCECIERYTTIIIQSYASIFYENVYEFMDSAPPSSPTTCSLCPVQKASSWLLSF